MDKKESIYHCGTLTYTKLALTFLFASLLWGDFCWALMEQVVPSIIPLKLKSLESPNWLIGLILNSIPSALGIFVAPWIAFKSDRCRSRFGRRIPFLALSLPFLCISLLLLGFSDDIGNWLRGNAAFLQRYTPMTISLTLLAVFIVIFQFFNLFVNTAFWYLFNDVVPPEFLARLIGGLRVIGGLAVVGYNYFIFQYAEMHMREIFVGAAVIYFIGFTILCTTVREGSYPEVVDEVAGKKQGIFSAFGRECFSDRFYWYSFLFSAFFMAANGAATFNIFFYQEMGLTLENIGKYNAIVMFVSLFAMYFVMSFIDRWHPMRVSTYYAMFACVGSLLNWVWLFVDLPGGYFFIIFTVFGVAGVLQIGLSGVMGLPRAMRIFPKSRYGQFSAAQGLIGGLCGLVCGVAIGSFIDAIRFFSGDTGGFSFRFLFVWGTFFNILAAVFGILSYRIWYRLGGDADFHAPASWLESGRERLPAVKTLGPSSFWLKFFVNLMSGMSVAVTVGVIVSIGLWGWFFGRSSGMMLGAVLIVPAVAVMGLWRILRRRVLTDIDLVRGGGVARFGLFHHGVPMFIAAQQGILFINWIIQVVIAFKLGSLREIIVFTMGQLVSFGLIALGVWVLSREEKEHLRQLDGWLATGDAA